MTPVRSLNLPLKSASPDSDGLVLFTRYPEAGKTKTRLIPHLGAHQAARLQRRMTEHLVQTLRPQSGQRSWALEVHFAGGNLQAMQRWLGPELTYQAQASGDLGDRLQHTFANGFRQQRERIVVIGSDCPAITANHVEQAFHALQRHQVVLGPAQDGGYYLVGLNCDCGALFQNIAWSTPQVFEQTMAIATRLHLSLATLESLPDIDRPEDLVGLPSALGLP